MTPSDHDNATEGRARRILYIAVGFHFAIGLVLLVTSAMTGEYLGAFLGIAIVSGTLVAAVLIHWLLDIVGRASAVASTLDDLKAAVDAVRLSSGTSAASSKAPKEPSRVRTLDLAALGNGDPSRLAAATLDRDVFPRLVKTMDAAPPARSGELQDITSGDAGTTDSVGASSRATDHHETDAAFTNSPAAELAAKNLWRQWKVALRNEDIAGCRALFSALVETADLHRIAQLCDEMEALADRTERQLRLAFSLRVRERDYVGALTVGERICTLLPDRPIAGDFKRIQPYLTRRRDAQADDHSGMRTRAGG